MNKVTWGALNAKNDTAANLKAWIQAMHDNLIAAGLVQTSDTGQLNISGISAVAAGGAYLPPLLYRFNDTLAGASPVIIKIRPYAGAYGSSTTVANVAITIGRTTDGAGVLTGGNTGEFNFYNSTGGSYSATFAAAETQSYAIHSEGRFSLCLGVGAYTTGVLNSFAMVFIDVARTSSGLAIARNAAPYNPNLVFAPSVMRIQKGYLHSVMSAWHQDLSYWAGGSDAATSGGAVQLQRTYRLAPIIEPDPALALYWAPNVTTGDQFDLSVDGLTRNYIALGSGTGLIADPITNANPPGIALLWDDL